jgi:hypothetical protein
MFCPYMGQSPPSTLQSGCGVGGGGAVAAVEEVDDEDELPHAIRSPAMHASAYSPMRAFTRSLG